MWVPTKWRKGSNYASAGLQYLSPVISCSWKSKKKLLKSSEESSKRPVGPKKGYGAWWNIVEHRGTSWNMVAVRATPVLQHWFLTASHHRFLASHFTSSPWRLPHHRAQGDSTSPCDPRGPPQMGRWGWVESCWIPWSSNAKSQFDIAEHCCGGPSLHLCVDGAEAIRSRASPSNQQVNSLGFSDPWPSRKVNMKIMKHLSAKISASAFCISKNPTWLGGGYHFLWGKLR